MSTTIGPRIRELRKARKMTQELLASLVGVATPQISRWEQGTNGVPVSRLDRIAAALSVPTALLLSTDQVTALPIAPNAVTIPMEGPSMERMNENLPVFGTALGAPRVFEGEAVEQTMLNSGDVVQYVKRPVILNGRADAYGLYVQGQSMEPVHIEGDMILAERKRPARIGDDVVVYLRVKDEDDDGERARGVLLKRLVRRTARHYELQQFNPDVTFTVPIEDVVRVDRVLRLADLLA